MKPYVAKMETHLCAKRFFGASDANVNQFDSDAGRFHKKNFASVQPRFIQQF